MEQLAGVREIAREHSHRKRDEHGEGKLESSGHGPC
jgi:hypothetical protein